MFENTRWLFNSAYFALRRKKETRDVGNVLSEYSDGWASYAAQLENCKNLDDWLLIKGLEDEPTYCQVSGDLRLEAFDTGAFNKSKLLEVILREFPNIKSITEYGCGIGRNLLYIKNKLPHLDCYGYELCPSGVDLAKKAAEKFNLDVKYTQLDYVNSPESEYTFPMTDVSFTMFSLEQLPDTNKRAIINILNHTDKGSIHIEPSPENYPLILRGIIGRIDYWKVNYLRGFDKNLASLNHQVDIKKQVLNTSHNPLMYPTLYVIKNKSKC
jgi:SAM-dependent methyltransferase